MSKERSNPPFSAIFLEKPADDTKAGFRFSEGSHRGVQVRETGNLALGVSLW